MAKNPGLSYKQLDFLNWEFGVFFHFGIRSFYRGHKDWDGKDMPLAAFLPEKFDAFDWTETARKAGAKYVIFTAKHHDGFALWQSAYTEYGVKNTPWKGGKGDAVKEFAEAARKSGLKVGLYYSPAQWGKTAVKFENGKEYDDYFINQITELLTNYGKIDYLWFDGCGSENHEYDKERIVKEIYRLQPNILTFSGAEWHPDVRWIGNEAGYASKFNPLTVKSGYFSELATQADVFPEDTCIPAECDCKIRDTWFYDDNENTLKPADELFGMYESSVGGGSNFLLNVSPDDRGLLPEADKKRLLELGEKIAQYSSPVSFSAPYKDGENAYSIDAPCRGKPWEKCRENSQLVNRIVLREDLSKGQNAQSFEIYAYPYVYQNRKLLVYKGATIGHKAICHIPAMRASKFTLEIASESGKTAISEMKAYFVK